MNRLLTENFHVISSLIFFLRQQQNFNSISSAVILMALYPLYYDEFSHTCEGQSKITEPYLITFELSKMDIYLDDISLKLYVTYLIT